MRKSNEQLPKQQIELRVVVNNKLELDPEEPIPVSFNPEYYRYARNRKYVPFLGTDDNLPNILLEARLTSSTQNSCISSISQSLIGKGLKVTNVEVPDGDLVKWFKSVNKQRQTFDELLKEIADSERMFGNIFVEIIRGEILGKRFLRVALHSMLYCRLSKDTVDSDIQSVIISKQINRAGYSSLTDDFVEIPIWSPNPIDQKKVWKRLGDGFEHTALHFKNIVSGIDYYGLPASIAGLRYQVLEGKAAQFNIDNFDNNMILGGMLILKSGMSPEEAQATAREIIISHTGEGKTGRIAVVSSEAGLDEVEFIPYNVQREGSYNETDKRWEEKIIAANEWDSVLAGINRSSTFGNGSQYIRSIWDVKDAVLLNPLRNKLITKVIEPITDIYAEWFNKPDVADYEYTLQTNMPFSFMGELKPETFFKLKEARKLAGLEPDEVNGEKYLTEMTLRTNNVPDITQQPTDANQQ